MTDKYMFGHDCWDQVMLELASLVKKDCGALPHHLYIQCSV